MEKKHAVAVLIKSKEGVPLVRDPKKPAPVYWKLPGGRSEFGESADVAAARELKEELGFEIPVADLEAIYSEEREGHDFTLFEANVGTLEPMKKTGSEGEEIKIFPLGELTNLPDLFLNHKLVLKKLKIIS